MGQEVSQFQAGFEQEVSRHPSARGDISEMRSWAGEILEWSLYFTPDIWSPEKGRCLPTEGYHASYLKNFADCMLRRGYDDDEVAFWAEIVSRDFIKTTMVRVGILWICTELVKSGRYEPKGHTEEDLIYITGTEPKARKKMTWIWQQFRGNKRLKAHYGPLLPTRAQPETATGIEAMLNNGIWLAAFGMKGGMRSAHPRFLIVDDPEELAEGDEKKVAENSWSIWSRTVDGMMGPETSVFYTANYVGVRCLSKKLTKIHPKNYIERPCWKNKPGGGKVSLWAKRFSVNFLENKKRDIGESAFACEWELNPSADSGSPIKEEWIQMYDSSDREQFGNFWWTRCPIVIFFDPAYTDNTESDYTAIVTWCMDTRDMRRVPFFYCLDARRGKWTDHEEILERVRDVYYDFRQAIAHSVEVYVENAVEAEAKAFKTTNRLMNEKRRRTMPLKDWRVQEDGKTKKSRMSRTATFYREHRVYFDLNDPNQQDLIDELVLFGEADNDDYADAGTGGLNVFRVKESRLRSQYVQREERAKSVPRRDPHTGRLMQRVA